MAARKRTQRGAELVEEDGTTSAMQLVGWGTNFPRSRWSITTEERRSASLQRAIRGGNELDVSCGYEGLVVMTGRWRPRLCGGELKLARG